MSIHLAKGLAVLLSKSRSIVCEKKFDLEIYYAGKVFLDDNNKRYQQVPHESTKIRIQL